MKTTDPSFIGKRERMREKYTTKKNVRGKTKGVKKTFQRCHLDLLLQGLEQGEC